VSRKAWIASIALVVLLAGGTWLRAALGVEWSPESVRATVREAGIWAPLVFIALVTFRLVILIPSQILLTAAGLLFGAAAGTLYGAIGMTLSAIIIFAVVRIAGIDRIREQLPPKFSDALTIVRSNLGAGVLMIASGYPVGPISAFQTGAALSGMGFLTFLAAVATGGTVRAAAYSYFGSTLFDGTRLISGAAVLAFVALAPLAFPRARARIMALFENLYAKTDLDEREKE
jgi:uncharacterized membrane protein YdjX (TVP38/TMEM64 family)